MSPNNKISFAGILGPLVESLERKQRQPGRLVGQDVVISDTDKVTAIIAVDSDNDIHLLISPAQTDDGHFSKLELKGLRVENREWSVSGRPAQNYLDIACATGALSSFKRPFLRFAEDVLFEISKKSNSPADAVYRTGMKWKRFWSDSAAGEVTSEWLHGLAGELSFLTYLIRKLGPQTIGAWTGPAGKDHDFQSGTDVAAEVKASVDIPFKINCNLRQLDPALFRKLYIVCYQTLPSEKGVTLPEIIEGIENFINDEQLLDGFHERLAAAGYNRQLEPIYTQHPLQISPAKVYLVDDSFPKITEDSFITPPDHRISNIRYTLSLTGVGEINIDDVEDFRLFRK